MMRKLSLYELWLKCLNIEICFTNIAYDEKTIYELWLKYINIAIMFTNIAYDEKTIFV